MPTFRRPPDPRDPELFDALVLEWWPYCERYAATLGRARPAVDYASRANMVIWKAAATFDPALGVRFKDYLVRGLRADRGAAARTEDRRDRMLHRVEMPAAL